ncbi:hypothetical protein R3P38DRAFT_3433612 [Favolaschia claudopus]|uniref:SHSP domain-containing protein n=1 Tax=Favolaschia claudopus TaxID=2862362 RepID=A0AAW0D291_9AGAR
MFFRDGCPTHKTAAPATHIPISAEYKDGVATWRAEFNGTRLTMKLEGNSATRSRPAASNKARLFPVFKQEDGALLLDVPGLQDDQLEVKHHGLTVRFRKSVETPTFASVHHVGQMDIPRKAQHTLQPTWVQEIAFHSVCSFERMELWLLKDRLDKQKYANIELELQVAVAEDQKNDLDKEYVEGNYDAKSGPVARGLVNEV